MLFPQNPCIELYNASSNDILQLWKIRGKTKKEFEPYSKSYYHILLTGGVSILSLPIQEKQTLKLSNLFLLFQFVLLNHKSFLIELIVTDNNNIKKMLKITLDNNYPLNIWTNLLIDLEELTQQYFKTQTYKVIDNIHISGCLKIRKVFSIKSKDEPIMKSVDMGNIPVVNLFFVGTGNLIKKDIKIIENNNLYINNVNINSNSLQSKVSPPRNNKRENIL